jgi:hypothetical protein
MSSPSTLRYDVAFNWSSTPIFHISITNTPRLCTSRASLFLPADITTKDLLTDRQLCRSAPCCPGTRSPAQLLAAWQRVCCGPVLLRKQHTWRPLPAEDATSATTAAVATAAVPAGSGVDAAGSSGGSSRLGSSSGSSSGNSRQGLHQHLSVAVV